MRSSGQFQTFLFLRKNFCTHKKHKNANKQINNFFPLRWFLWTYKRWFFCFCLLICVLCFLCMWNLFVNKMKVFKIALMTLSTLLLTYKDKIKDKYSYLKHLTKTNLLHFYHHLCDTKMINGVTTSIRFLQQNIHKRKDFSFIFLIHIIPEPKPFKYYNYFNIFDFFEFYQIHKYTFGLHAERAFHSYLSAADTEIFTTYEKFTDPNGPYKSISDYNIYIFSSG